MSKADNMLSILWLLNSERKMTAKQLADKLEINIRTVYRYIDALCASGVPIISDTGHHGGYSLLNRFTEAPLIFDLDEQKALLHAAIFAKEAGYPFSQELTRATEKLKSYSNQRQSEHIDRHLEGFEVINTPINSSLEVILKELELSVAECYTLIMEYHTEREASSKTRRIDPYGLIYWKSKWYLVAYCYLRNEIRSFRVDRIKALSRTDIIFERPAGFSARQFFMKNLLPDTNENKRLVPVCIQGTQMVITELCEHWLLGHMIVEKSINQVKFMVEEQAMLTFVPYFLLAYGKSIQVLEPIKLREKLVQIISELLNHYKI